VGPADTMAVTYALGEQMLILSKKADSTAAARRQLEESISTGRALQKFRDLIHAQGGDVGVVDDVSRLPKARKQLPLLAPRGGFVVDVDAMAVALAALQLGAGRAHAEDKVDHAVGVTDLVKIGEKVTAGGRLCTVHGNNDEKLAVAQTMLAKAIVVGDAPPPAQKLIDEIIG
jgi:pyrimidine-nucleoside phosphorylase